jgi:hypothetical protein
MAEVPLNRSALQHQPGLLAWLRSWVPSLELHLLEPQDWYSKGHGVADGSLNADGMWLPNKMESGWLVWHPPPALAADAVYELGVARHKRKHLNHIFLVPRLMTFEWRKALQKTCNYMFTIPPGSRTYWPKSEFEPLIVGLTLHFPASSPWQVKRSRRFLGMERTLRGLWKTPEGTEGALLRELCLSPTIMEAL